MAVSEQYSRSALLYGDAAIEKLRASSVLLFGVGGVGGYVCEALARMGVGRIALCDGDTVSVSNINRQIIATHETVGMRKVDAARERIHAIAPDTAVETYPIFYLPENADAIDIAGFDYIADAIDTVRAKIEIIARAKAAGIPVISAMGAGNKLDPTAFRVADIEKTRVCPLARVMRQELRKRDIRGVKVVYSEELPVAFPPREDGSRAPGSNPFCPPAAGLCMAAEIVRDLISQ